jgi:hypothetical protein
VEYSGEWLEREWFVDSAVVAVKPAQRADQRRIRRLLPAEWIVLGLFLLAAVVVTIHVWAHPSTEAPTTTNYVHNDIYLNVWFMRYVADAISHGHLPSLVTTALNAPQGVNAMWNTSLLIPGILLTPVTLIAGPVVSLAIFLTLGFAGSAASMFLVLRRWEVSIGAAALGGAFYAFTPALMIAAEDHYHLMFAVLPPLIADAAIRIALGRSTPIRGGIWLGVLVAIQIFIAEELLVDTALATGVILFILFCCRPRAALERVGDAFAGVGIAVGVALVICSYAFWVQFHGPLTEHGSPWKIPRYGNHIQNFITPPLSVLWHNKATFVHSLKATGIWPAEMYGFLGWPLIIAMVAITIFFWHDLRIRVMSLSFWGIEWLTMGGRAQVYHGIHIPAALFPFHYLMHIPLLDEIVVNRLSIMGYAACAVAFAFAAERIIGLVRQQQDWRKPAFATGAVVALAAVAIPIFPAPVPAARLKPVPAGWNTVFRGLHLKHGANVLLLPMVGSVTMEWQARTNEPISIVGGYCVAPGPAGKATQCNNMALETWAQQKARFRIGGIASAPPIGKGPAFSTFELALRQWQVAAVVMPPGFNTKLRSYLVRFFGKPTAGKDGMYGWRLGDQWWKHLPWESRANSGAT